MGTLDAKIPAAEATGTDAPIRWFFERNTIEYRNDIDLGFFDLYRLLIEAGIYCGL